MANVTRGISKGVQSGFIMREDIDVNYVQEKLYCKDLLHSTKSTSKA